jgi:hypothetical protein
MDEEAVRGGEPPSHVDEPVSPELVLVCPELRSRCLTALPALPPPPARAVEPALRPEPPARPELAARPEPASQPKPPPRPRPAQRATRRRRHLRLIVTAAGVLAASAALGGLSPERPFERPPGPTAVAPQLPQIAARARIAPARPAFRRDAFAAGSFVSASAARRLAALITPPKPPPATPEPASDPPEPAQPSEIEPASQMLGPLPDPTPRPVRLQATTARKLLAVAAERHLDWALLAADLRAGGPEWPAPPAWAIKRAAARLQAGRDEVDDELLVLAQYDRSVGIDALIGGLTGARAVLAAQVLRDPRISIYRGGRSDVAAGRVDVRVLSLLLFLARRTGQVTVSSLVTGHPAPLGGGRSSHAFGAAVEITSLGGVPVSSGQAGGGPVERAIRAMLLLPEESRPRHVASLIDLGPSTIALADFRDHVQISFDPTARLDRYSLRVLWQLAAQRYGVPWRVLAAINQIESNFGRNMGPSSAGAVGWMQFLPSTWRRWGVDANGDGRADPANPADAIFAAARYLAAAGAGRDLRRAIFAYNHADWYVNDVLRLAGRF